MPVLRKNQMKFWPTRTAQAVMLGLAMIHAVLAMALAGSPRSPAPTAGDDLPANRESAVVGRVVDVAGNPLASISVGLAPAADNGKDFYMNNVLIRTITDADGRFAIPPVKA